MTGGNSQMQPSRGNHIRVSRGAPTAPCRRQPRVKWLLVVRSATSRSARPRTAAQVSELAAKFRQDGTKCTRPGCSAEMLVIGQRAEYTDTAVNVLQFRQCAKCMHTSNAAATYK